MDVVVLKSVVESVAECLNVLSKVLNKQGLWHLIGLQGPIGVLVKLDLAKLKAELLDLSELEREQVLAAFRGKLDLVNKTVQVKLGEVLDLLEELIDLGEDTYEFGVNVYTKGKSLYDKAKKILGL